MKARKKRPHPINTARPPSKETPAPRARSAEILEEFEELKGLETESPAAPFDRKPPTRRDYRPGRFSKWNPQSPSLSPPLVLDETASGAIEIPDSATADSRETMGAESKTYVPEGVQFAAFELVDALVHIAHEFIDVGVPCDAQSGAAHDPPERRPYTREFRRLAPSDEKRIARAFKALFGVAPEDYWEIVLAKLISDNLFVRGVRASAVFRDPMSADDPAILRPLTGDEIVRMLGAHVPHSTVPFFVTAKAIDLAMQQCTDARGGGRGDGAKISVRRWIQKLKAAARKGRNSRR